MASGDGAQPGSLVPPRNNITFGRLPPSHQPDGPKIEECYINTHYDLCTTIVLSIYIVIGLFYTFFGYRCFKIVMFLTGFIFAMGIVYSICLQGELLPPYGNAGVALLAGVLFGIITMMVQYVGLFMGGLHTGLLLALAGLIIADFYTKTSHEGSIWLCVGILLASALFFAIFNLYFRKGLTILGTSLYGGCMIAISVDYFLERFATVDWIKERVILRPTAPLPCWYSWFCLSTWPSLSLFGLIVQCFITGTGIHHEDVAAGRKKLRPNSNRNRIDRAELRQKKYRYLYQVRTSHGDVVSQNFVESLHSEKNRERNLGGGSGECSTLQSDATHLTILPDANLGVLTESEDENCVEIVQRR